MPPDLAVVALIAAFNEADVIGQVVGDLVAQGVSVYLLDHGSTDGTVEVARQAGGRGLVGLERLTPEDAPPGRFSLAAILRRKEALARDLAAGWFINADADELRESPWPEVSLAEAIRRVDRLGYTAIDFELFDFLPTDDSYRPGADLRTTFRFFAPGRSWNKAQVRCWKNLGRPVDLVSTGGHEARFEGRVVCPLRFILRHYPFRSQAQAERKVFEERQPRFDPTEKARGWHVQYDDLVPGTRFVVDPSTLRAYDGDAVRWDLVLHHRGVEDLETRAADLGREIGQARWELDAARAEAEGRARELATWQESSRQLAATVEELTGERDRLTAEHRRLAGERADLAEEHTRLTAALASRESRLAEILASRSWRWMAPLRAAHRLLTGAAG